MDSTFDLEWCHSNLLKAVEPLSIFLHALHPLLSILIMLDQRLIKKKSLKLSFKHQKHHESLLLLKIDSKVTLGSSNH